MTLRFDDHASFHRAAIGMTAGAAILGAALQPVTQMAPIVGGMFGIAVGATLGYGKPVVRLAAAGLACLPLFLMSLGWSAFALSAGVLALGTTIGAKQNGDERGMRAAMTAMLGATITLLAMWTAMRFDHARALVHSPGWITSGLASAAMGMVGVVAMLPRHLGFSIDRVALARKELPTNLDSEVRSLCGRTIAIWSDIDAKLGEDDPGKALVRDAVVTTLEVASKSTEAQLTASDEELGKRMEDLDARIAAATDDEVKSQYTAARATLTDQRKYRERIRQNRERLVARMHNHLAALEKFQLAVGHRTEMSASEQLQDLSRDVAASGEALVEVGEA
ncbi:MAG TPA: hypothetical protein VGC41_16795 [Kofleriaceae bacterium]